MKFYNIWKNKWRATEVCEEQYSGPWENGRIIFSTKH